jgi:TonB family protein
LTDPQTRHSRGLLVVILLGLIFFALLALIILKTGGNKTPPVPLAETVVVLPIRVRIRTEANAGAPVVATATTGEQLQMLESQGAWVRVQTNDGLTGWAERANLERTAERERRLQRYQAIRKLPALQGVTSDHAQLYAGPGIFYPLVGDVAAGTSVRVYTRDHDFYAIDYNDQIAYADIDRVDVTASGSPQLNVATNTTTDTSATAVTETTSTELVPPAETASAEPPPPPPPAPMDTIDDSMTRPSVYSAVPPGGTQPEELSRGIPRYPAIARSAGVGGAVVIRGVVRKDGSIDNVEVIKDLPYGLGEAAKEAVERWRFRPATYRGEPIDVYYTVTVNFRLR